MFCKQLFYSSLIVSIALPLKVSSLAVSSYAVATTPTIAAATSVNRQALADAPPFPRTWVPLASTFELDPDRPTPLKFLNQDYIAYRDNNEQWIVMDDACPHRLAPLSEGRIDREKNRIECSYHGWSFDSTGSCQRIPQLVDDENDGSGSISSSASLRAALASPRSCVAAYPTQVHKNILFAWLWPEDPLSVMLGSDGGDIVAGATPESMLEAVANHTTTYTRDLPYSWEILIENLIDPAHVPFAHHGLQGTRQDAIPINMSKPIPFDNPASGFSFRFGDRTMGMRRQGIGEFRAPYVVSYYADFESSSKKPKAPFNFKAICIPTAPGWSRTIIVSTDSSKEEPKAKKSILGLVFGLLPKWLIHQLSNRFLDSDLAFLHYQEKKRARRGVGTTAYFTPAPADRAVVELYKWINKYAHEQSPYTTRTGTPSDAESLTIPRSVLFDRQAQHTSHCRICQEAQVGIKKWRRNVYGILVLSILGIKLHFMAQVAAVVCLGVLKLLAVIEKAFQAGDFKHYENN